MNSTESINELTDLFLLIAKQDKWNHNLNKDYLNFFFRHYKNPELVQYLSNKYDEKLGDIALNEIKPESHIQVDLDSVKTLANAKRIIKHLSEEEKLVVLGLLCEQAKTGDFITTHRTEIIEAINSVFGLDKNFFNAVKSLVLDENPYQSADENVLVIDPEEISLYNRIRGVKHERLRSLDKAIAVRKFEGFENLLVLKYFGNRALNIAGQTSQPKRFYVLRPKESIQAEGFNYTFEQLNSILSAKFSLNSLKLDVTEKTPAINFDVSTNKLLIKGVSIPEDALAFYKPLLHWLGLYMQQKPVQTELIFQMEFFNTVSSRLFLEIMKVMQRLKDAGTDVTIRWIYEDGDEDIQEAGENYADMVSVKFIVEAAG